MMHAVEDSMTSFYYREETVERGRTVRLNLNDGEINIDHDPTADQDALLGGAATRRRLIDMPAEEAKREVRCV